VIGKRTRFVVIVIDIEPCSNRAVAAQALVPFRGNGRFPVAGGSREEDQAARCRNVKQAKQFRPLDREVADSRRYSLGQSNTRQLN
jgi:hypothetical protein